jgi:hypothetical protein
MRRKSIITAVVLLAALSAGLAAYAGGGMGMGMGSMGLSGSIKRPALHGFYDGHKDTFLNTDVSDKTQAAEMHVNYSKVLKAVPMSATSEIYLVQGKAAPGQIPVFGSEPGETSYTPLWHEMLVTWKAGVKPVLLVKDDQINALAHKGKLTLRMTHVILNCPIVHPTKSVLSGS